MKIHFPLFVLVSIVALLFSTCKTETVVPNEEEIITTLTYKLTLEGGTEVITFSYKDLDGDGANSPTISSAPLGANQTYKGVITVLNESESPAENITTEIKDEDDEHQFFFEVTNLDVTITYDDEDGNQHPLGLATTLKTGAAGSGNLTITLRHKPNKSASHVSDGDITNAGGETDIEVTFPLTVE